nr:MAG TPA: hypothetical protein [Inoviridae sp.]
MPPANAAKAASAARAKPKPPVHIQRSSEFEQSTRIGSY